MIHQFKVSDRTVIWINTDDLERYNKIRIYSGSAASVHGGVVQWRVDILNVSAWMGARNPNVEYFRSKLSSGWINNISLGTAAGRNSQATRSWENFTQAIFDLAQRAFPFCRTCNTFACPDPNAEESHTVCGRCELAIIDTDRRFLTVGYAYDCQEALEEIDACNRCYTDTVNDNLVQCCAYQGGFIYWDDDDRHVDEDGNSYCREHFIAIWTECDICASLIRVDEDYEGLCHTCFLDEGGCDCNECMPQRASSSVVQRWDYRPELIFHPPVPTNPKKPLYIGMELETSFGRSGWVNQISNWYRHSVDQNLIYVKSDSSVANGIEIVTHPMEPRWALKNFPFKAFDDLINDHGALETHPSCGTHVHMNKEAFTQAHMWKFMQVHYRLPQFLKTIGGRDDSTYASFGMTDMRIMREDLMKIVKEKDKGQDYDRYVAVNLRNEHTIELRYPASGSSGLLIRKNIELALALYEFTDYLTVDDVKDGAIDDPGYLMHWIRSNDYPSLAKYMDSKFPNPKQLKARTV